jgi:hypothetical protein
MNNDNPSIYEAYFYSVWETFADRIGLVFKDEDPTATVQTRYLLANMAIADLLRDIGQEEIARHFHLFAEALEDLLSGIKHPLFKVGVAGKRGRQHDTSATWRNRAYLVLGLEYLIAAEMEPDAAVNFVCRQHRQKLAKLQRPGAKLKSSLVGWRKQFANDEVTNEFALSAYKHGMAFLKSNREALTRVAIKNTGKKYLARVAAGTQVLP